MVFVPVCESLSAYVERVELYLVNKIIERKKILVFISVLGSRFKA